MPQGVPGRWTATTEAPEEPSKIFAPAGFVTTAAEKELDKEWNELIASGAVRAPGAAHTHTDRHIIMMNRVVGAVRTAWWWTR